MTAPITAVVKIVTKMRSAAAIMLRFGPGRLLIQQAADRLRYRAAALCILIALLKRGAQGIFRFSAEEQKPSPSLNPFLSALDGLQHVWRLSQG
jgi:hypothetical protein